MIGLCVKIGFMSAGIVVAASAPSTAPGPSVIFMDRFGGTWYQDRRLEGQELVAAIGHARTSGGELQLLFEPFSLAEDREEMAEFLKKAFPNLRVMIREVRAGEGFRARMFPGHQPQIQTEVLSRRSVTWEELVGRNRQLADQVQSYLTTLLSQWSKARSDINTLQHEYQHLTPRGVPKTNSFVPSSGLNPALNPQPVVSGTGNSSKTRK
jgi:hypothetical protein